MSNLADIGLVGLAVMGENLVLNMESKGFEGVSLFVIDAPLVHNYPKISH